MTAIPKWWVIGNAVINSEQVSQITIEDDGVSFTYCGAPQGQPMGGKAAADALKKLIADHPLNFQDLGVPIP